AACTGIRHALSSSFRETNWWKPDEIIRVCSSESSSGPATNTGCCGANCPQHDTP
ncbi:hypothetical protein K0M31_015335, partial [Melipona bicolor]